MPVRGTHIYRWTDAQFTPCNIFEVFLRVDREFVNQAAQSPNFTKQNSTKFPSYRRTHHSAHTHTHCLHQQNTWRLPAKCHTKHHTPPRQHSCRITPPTRRPGPPVTASFWTPHYHPHLHAQNRPNSKPQITLTATTVLRVRWNSSSYTAHTISTQGPSSHARTGAPLGAPWGNYGIP